MQTFEIRMDQNVQKEIGQQKQNSLLSDNRTGIPDEMRMRFERASGISLENVRVSYHSEKPAQLHADAYTKGNRVYIGSGQEKLLGHELAHVIQQSTQRILPDGEYNGVPVTLEKRYESEADSYSEKVMGLDLNLPAAHGNQTSCPLRSVALDSESMPVQGSFQDVFFEKRVFGSGTKSLYTAICDEDYRKHAKKFEYGMAPLIMKNAAVNRQADRMLKRLEAIVDGWCLATHRETDDFADTLQKVYGTAFADQTSEGFYGAIDATVGDVIEIFRNPGMPLRLKYRLLYNSIRNNNLTKWLKVLSIQYHSLLDGLKMGGGWGDVKDVAIKESDTVSGKPYQDLDTTVVGKSFIRHALTFQSMADQLPAVFLTQQRERPGNLPTAYADVFGGDIRSSLFDFQPEQGLATQERIYSMDVASALEWQERRAANMIPPDDLTRMERVHSQRIGIPRVTEKHDRSKKMTPWTQGREGYLILPSTETAKLANELKAGMAAGISGSTDLMFHAAQYLGFNGGSDKKTLRLGLAGWMIAGRDHSFFEVYRAAENYGTDFHYDKNVIGSEYEDAGNLYPMKKTDFGAILEGGKFPGYYYSDDYLRKVISENPFRDVSKFDFITLLHKATSLEEDSLWHYALMDGDAGGLILAHIDQLYCFIKKQPLGTRDFKKKNFAQIRSSYQKIRRSAHYIYIANMLPLEESDRILSTLLTACDAPLDMQVQLEQDSGEGKKALLVRQGLSSDERDRRRGQIDDKTRVHKLKRLKFKQEILDELHPWLIYCIDFELEELRRKALKPEAPDLKGAWAIPARLHYELFRVLLSEGKEAMFQSVVEEYQKAAAILLYSKSETDTKRVEEFRKLQEPKQAPTSKQLSQEELEKLLMPEEFGRRGDAVREEEYWGIRSGQIRLDVSSEKALDQIKGLDDEYELFTAGAMAFFPDQPEKVLDYLFGGMPASANMILYRSLAELYLDYDTAAKTWRNKRNSIQRIVTWLRKAADDSIHSIVTAPDSDEKKRQIERFKQYYHYRCQPFYEAMETQASLSALNPKELGAIYQYTTNLYKDIVKPEEYLLAEDLSRRGKLEPDDAHEGEFGTLTTIEPLIKAASSGLSRLPAYPRDVYRIVEGAQFRGLTGAALLGKGRSEIPLSTITYPYMMSAAKSPGSDFIVSHSDYMVMEHIQNIKTGHDIQGISRYYGEQEVLFEPGSKLRTTGIDLDPLRPAQNRLVVEKEEV